MAKLYICTIFAIIFCMLLETVKALDDIPELILEETEYGYIIINWEDTRIEDKFPPQGETHTPPILNPPPQNKAFRQSKTVVAKAKKLIRKKLSGGSKKD